MATRSLQLIADPTVILDAEGFARVLAAMRAGLDVVQVRGPQASARTMFAALQRLRPHAEACGISLLVNDRVDVALVVNVEPGQPVGVHLGGRSLPVAVVKRAFPSMTVSASVHSIAEGIAAMRDGDPPGALTLGHIFATSSHPGGDPIGLDPLRELVQAVDVPVIAIGGIDVSNVRSVLETGAAGVAVISAILRVDDPARATADLRAVLDTPAGGLPQ
jgi:thiamine-phosphate diphosphorylase